MPTPCPCGSALAYSACCGRFHAGEIAPTAEALMRSRYSAYTRGLTDYLLATWHPDTRPQTLDLSDNPKWLGLKVLRHEQSDASHAAVEFVARYKIAGRAFRMQEVSRFERIEGRWYYRDGEVERPEKVAKPLADPVSYCDHAANQDLHHDQQTTATPRPASQAMARRPSGRGQPARSLSPAAGELRPELDGAGTRAGRSGPTARPAQPTVDSTRPLDATRELATTAGSLTYTQISERLAVNIVHCLDDLLDSTPEDIAITPDWLRGIHNRLAGELFPEWGGRFRTTDVQVGTHLPPPAHTLAEQVSNFCLDLTERLRHLTGAESIADLLAWVDWRFQWIHPFKDFNGRVGRILLVTLAYKLGLPPVDPAANDAQGDTKYSYFSALRAADRGDLTPLRDIWLERLEN